MQVFLTFIIPVRHQENAKNWGELRRQLEITAASIARQTRPEWRAIVVANNGADLPPLPIGFDVCYVEFPPNPLHERQQADLEAFREAVRLDKGRRILAGLLYAFSSNYFMFVDDDDLVSRHLTEFVAMASAANGWFIRDGYIWSGGKWLYLYDDFSNYCGTSHIVRADLLCLPPTAAAATNAYISRTLGSHRLIEGDLAASNTPLTPLPFPGAVYRTGHASSHSKSSTLFRYFFLQRNVALNPLRLGSKLLRLRRNSRALQEEFLCKPEFNR